MDIVTVIVLANLLPPVVRKVNRALTAYWVLDDKMPEVNRAFNKVRDELLDVGLLADEVYLDEIELKVGMLPSNGEAGYVFERTTPITRMVGYEEGVIYLPSDLPKEAYVPGGTLTDTIRHEFGHTWHWIEPKFFETGWFEKAFGAEYDDGSDAPFQMWSDKLYRSRRFQGEFEKLRSDGTRQRCFTRYLLRDFVSEYAATQPCEDFAETFMFYLHYRNSLDRFRESRPGVYRKLKAVERAVRRARRELGL